MEREKCGRKDGDVNALFKGDGQDESMILSIFTVYKVLGSNALHAMVLCNLLTK